MPRLLARLLGLRSKADRWWIDGAIAIGREASVDLVLGELVPYTTADAAATLARELGVPWVADLQDPWALDEMWQYPTALQRLADLRRMRKLLGSAAAIVMNTPEAAVRLTRRLPDLREKIVVSIPNGFDAADFASEAPTRDDGAFRIVHTGYLHTEFGLAHRRRGWLRRLLGGLPVPTVDYLARSHVYLLEAVNRLLAEDRSLRSQLEVHLVGVLSKTDERVAASCPVVHLHGYRPHGETVDLVRTADLLFLPMHDLPPGTRAGLVPGKTYEYLASGRPILAAVPDGDARDLLAEAGTALLCRPRDTAAMAEAIRSEVARWRHGRPVRPARPDIVNRYERRRQAEAFADVLGQVLGEPTPPTTASGAGEARTNSGGAAW
jgi:glycosyltransferase involved in cell wall biosynthesis